MPLTLELTDEETARLKAPAEARGGTEAVLRAADLWAQARNAGVATADIHALDGDVILVAQALELGVPDSEIIVATSNVRHNTRFIAADLWTNIRP